MSGVPHNPHAHSRCIEKIDTHKRRVRDVHCLKGWNLLDDSLQTDRVPVVKHANVRGDLGEHIEEGVRREVLGGRLLPDDAGRLLWAALAQCDGTEGAVAPQVHRKDLRLDDVAPIAWVKRIAAVDASGADKGDGGLGSAAGR